MFESVRGVFTFRGQLKSLRDLSLLLTCLRLRCGAVAVHGWAKSTCVNRICVSGKMSFFLDNNRFTLDKSYLQLVLRRDFLDMLDDGFRLISFVFAHGISTHFYLFIYFLDIG